MIPDIHKARWNAFIAQHPDQKPKTVSHKSFDKGWYAMHRQSFANPGQAYDQQQWALMLWQMDVMNDARWHGLQPRLHVVTSFPSPKQIDGAPVIDPDLFRF